MTQETGSKGAAEYPNQAGERALEPFHGNTPSTPCVPVAALRALVADMRTVKHPDEDCVEGWANDLAALCDAAERTP